MPIHDWSNVASGLFHHFHQQWSCAICDYLNQERLGDGYYALVEGRVPALRESMDTAAATTGGGLAVADAPPKAWLVSTANEDELYATRANRVAVRAADAHLVAITLPDMPVFLDADTYVPLALETTYAETWLHCPRQYREQVSPA